MARSLRGGQKNKALLITASISLFLILSLTLTACGGGGGGAPVATDTGTSTSTSTSTGTSTSTVAITGNLSAAAAKPSSGKSVQLYAVSSWAGATLQVIDSAGTVVGAGTVNADGTYSVSVPTGSNYFIKVQIGNLVLKAFVPSVTAAASVNVNTTTTAEVMVLASVLGVANIGDSGVSAATAIAAVNMTTVITQIEANTNLATIAGSLATEISNNYNASATTASIGSASTSVTTTVTTIAVSIPQSVAVVVAIPSAPTGIGVTAGNAQATISWTAVTGATSYNVYYRTTTGVTTANGTKVTGATSPKTITSLTNGTTYYFVVMAVNAGGESVVSSEVSTTPQVPAPSAPTGVSAAAGNAQATISWTAVTGAASYNVYYRNAAGVTIANGTKVAGATSPQTITGLTNGTAYYFVVTAVNAIGESAISTEVSSTPSSAPNISGNVPYVPNDPLFADQWHLKNTGQAGGTAGEDLNIEKVWTSYKGTGVRIAIVDDGLDLLHEDLAANVIAGASWDYNLNTGAGGWVAGGGNLITGNSAHGTSCGGLAAAVVGNATGGVGVAPTANLVGYNLLSATYGGNEADAMTRGSTTNSVSTNSWGAADGTGTLQPSSTIWQTAINTGITSGRGGKGIVYTWAAGNGYPNDRSDYDGQANLWGVISVAALNDTGNPSSYSEQGSDLLV